MATNRIAPLKIQNGPLADLIDSINNKLQRVMGELEGKTQAQDTLIDIATELRTFYKDFGHLYKKKPENETNQTTEQRTA